MSTTSAKKLACESVGINTKVSECDIAGLLFKSGIPNALKSVRDDDIHVVDIHRGTSDTRSEGIWRYALDSLFHGVIIADRNGRISYMNTAAQKLTRRTPADAYGRCFTDVCQLVADYTHDMNSDPLNANTGAETGSILVDHDGRCHRVEIKTASLLAPNGNQYGSVYEIHDISKRLAQTRRLIYEATHDVLTGLINRREPERRPQNILQHRADDGRDHTLAIMDLDGFKKINDCGGPLAGGKVL